MSKKAWATPEEIADLDYLFREAALTDSRLPTVFKRRINTSWLEIPSDWNDYGWDKGATTRLQPTQKQIDRYQQALDLGLKLPEEDRRLIWAVAISVRERSHGTWTRLAKKYRCDRRTVKSNHRGALMRAFQVSQ